MALASKHRAVFQPHHARATSPRGTCTAAGGLDAETLRGFQLAGELFLLTSFFIEPKGCEFETCLGSQTNFTSNFFCLPVNCGWQTCSRSGQ
jgi:hypothetical protein